MADDLKTNVILCKWKKTPGGYRLWVKGRPGIFGEADSFESAEKALTDAIWDAAEDLDAVIPTVPLYDPPLPPAAVAEPFLKPELYLVSGDGIFDIETLSGPDGEEPVLHETRRKWIDEHLRSLYTGGFCKRCRNGIGDRTEQSVQIGDYDSDYDGGFIRLAYGEPCGRGHVYSDRFLAILTAQEREPCTFRPLRLTKPSGKRQYHELVGTPAVPFVGTKGFDVDGSECHECGHRWFWIREPTLEQPQFSLNHFVCWSDLPDPVPSCFTVGFSDEPYLCCTRERWDEIRGRKGTKGIYAEPLGVVSDEQCDPHPRLHLAFKACWKCSPWPEPATVTGKTRRVWALPAIDAGSEACSARNLQWIKSAGAAALIQIVRQTITLDAIEGLITSGKGPKRPEVISFRCTECWRLGRIVMKPRELSLNW